jgi:RNA polymerase sigma-70 factor (ECF subfamily)
MGKNDHELIRATLSGDKDAFGTLVAAHGQKLFRVAFRIMGNEADAEDVVQEAILRGYRKLDTFESRSDFGTWIYRIAVRCALDRMVDRKTEATASRIDGDDLEQASLQVEDSAGGPDRLLLSGEIRAWQQMAMRSLTSIERTAFVLRHMEGCSTDEIAVELNLAPNAAKQAVFRAVQKLRQRLAVLKVRT